MSGRLFHEGDGMLVINSSECIDCGVNPSARPEGILPDTEDNLEKWLELNAKYSAEWPQYHQPESSARR
jgi:ferredoxin